MSVMKFCKKHSESTTHCVPCSLESELAAAKARIDNLKSINLDNCDTIHMQREENKRLESELVSLSGKTNFCVACESYARVNEKLLDTIQRNEDKSVECEKLREALKKIVKAYPLCPSIAMQDLAKCALDGGNP